MRGNFLRKAGFTSRRVLLLPSIAPADNIISCDLCGWAQGPSLRGSPPPSPFVGRIARTNPAEQDDRTVTTLFPAFFPDGPEAHPYVGRSRQLLFGRARVMMLGVKRTVLAPAVACSRR